MKDQNTRASHAERCGAGAEPPLVVALYARVSSERQATDLTIHSQVEALRQRIAEEGLTVAEERCFLDDGYSGESLQRPALERLRDLAWSGAVDRVYIHSPDRLARKYVWQMVVLEEFRRHGVEVVFLNQAQHDASPEAALLVQMQGVFAEYERAKILERCRRGRRFAARQGKLSALGHAPYGYRYLPKRDGGEAQYQVVPEEAPWVQQMFRWVGLEGLSLRQTARRLAQAGVASPRGKNAWRESTIVRMLQNPAYKGLAAFGRKQMVPRPAQGRPRRGQPRIPRHPTVARPAAPEQVETIAVPALVSAELFAAVGVRLAENRRRQRERQEGAKYLLSGLLVCQRCGSAYCGRRSHGRRSGTHVFYRCLGTDKARFDGEKICANRSLNAALTEAHVWQDVCALVHDRERLQREFERRLQRAPGDDVTVIALQKTITGAKRRLARLLEAWENDWIERCEFERRIVPLREQLRRDEELLAAQQRRHAADETLQLVLGDFQHFAEQIAQCLEDADFETKRKILRLLVKRIEVNDEAITIVYAVQPHACALPSPACPDSPVRADPLQHRSPFATRGEGEPIVKSYAVQVCTAG